MDPTLMNQQKNPYDQKPNTKTQPLPKPGLRGVGGRPANITYQENQMYPNYRSELDGLSYQREDKGGDEEEFEDDYYDEKSQSQIKTIPNRNGAVGGQLYNQNNNLATPKDSLSLMQRNRALTNTNINVKPSRQESQISGTQLNNMQSIGGTMSQNQFDRNGTASRSQIDNNNNADGNQPTRAFDEAYNKGKSLTNDDERQVYHLKQTNQGLQEDNILLKAENTRLVKLLYEKEKTQQEENQLQIDVKDRKIKSLEGEIEQYQKVIEELRLDVVSKQLDRDSLKAQLINKSFSPVLFLNDYSRNEFWKMITRYESDALAFQEDKLTIQQEILQQRSIITKQESEISELNKQLEDYFTLRKELTTMKLEYDRLFDRYKEVEHLQLETNLKFSGIERSYFHLEKEKEESSRKVVELSNLLHERSVESNNEKKALREFLQRLEQEKGLAEDANKREKDFSSYRVGAKVSRPFSLSDYFVRLKTTSISSEKYAETIDILYELFKTEQANQLKSANKLDTQSSVTHQLKQKDNYKLFLKAFASKNSKVLLCCYKMVRELGDIEDRVQEFIESQASASLIKSYKLSDDYSVKQETLYFLKILCDVSETVAIEVAKYGATQTIIDDLRKYTRGVNVLSQYLVDLLEFMSKVCKFNQGHAEFISPNCMSSLVLCLNSEKQENKIHSMNCIVFLAKSQENRTALSNYDVFNIVMTNLIRAVEAKERKVANAAIGALAYFSFERAYRILLANANQMFNFYELLLQSIQGQVGGTAGGAGVNSNGQAIEIPATTRYAAAVIIAKMLGDKDLFGVHDSIMKEGVLTYLAKGLRDKQSSVKKECAQIIIHLSKYIDNKPESFRPLINPLISALGDEDASLVVKSLDQLSEVSVEILKHSMSLLVVLISNADARQIMYEASVILPLLSFLSSEDIEVRGLWYEGLKELGAYSNFRAQLESAENSMLIVKRAIRQAETTFILQLIAVVRVICQSPVLLDRLIDPVTVPKLFEIYSDAMKWADSNIEIYVLQTLRLFFSNNNGKLHVLKNEQMLAYSTSCLAKENVNVANEAASLLIEVLQEPHQSLQIFARIPIVNSLLIYSKINNAVSVQRANELARIIKTIPFLFNEFKIKLQSNQ
eukprot:403363246